jgi:hypothetical protein
MPGLDHDRSVEQFEERLRSWGGRPPSLAPAVAANRVVGQLPDRGTAPPWLRLVAVGALLVLISVAAWLGSPARQAPVADTVDVAGSDEVVQFWLDPETPVYFILRKLGTDKGRDS